MHFFYANPMNVESGSGPGLGITQALKINCFYNTYVVSDQHMEFLNNYFQYS